MASKTSRSERRQQAVHRRRQEAARRTAAARKSARRRRLLKVLGAVVAVAVLLTGVTALVRTMGDDDSAPSVGLRAKKASGSPLDIAGAPTSYRGVYRAENYEGADVTISTEEVAVQRPFDGRVAILEGEPPGGTARFEGRSRFAEYANYTDAGAAQVAGDAPTVALGDIRLVASLDALVDQGLFVLGDRRRAKLGSETRDCQAYRTGSPLQGLKVTAPTATDYVDLCLDASGLMLEELVVAGGKPNQRLTAISLDLDVQHDPALFTIEGERVGTGQGGAEVTEVDRNTAPTPGYWVPDTTPAGYTHQGRYQVKGEGTGWVDVYVRGIDLLTIRQGPPAAEPDLSDDTGPGTDVDLGPLGAGTLFLRTIGPTAVAHPGDEAFVHVAGTVGPAEVQAVASGLRRT
ncbi:MAG TPA: hypothetical protein VJ653_08225 [Acidimicrobiales bacterium]|nr:hypothetical protein [Acidimicrobiales bacterium]